MNIKSSRRGRPNIKQRQLLQKIRSSIGSGSLLPDSQLPTIKELTESHAVSGVTVNKAMSTLLKDGFIRSVRGGGTYVASRPPNTTRFGLVFPWRPDATRPWSLFWKALTAAALQIEQSDGIEIPVFYDIESHAHQTRDYDNLLRAVESDQLAGLIFAHSPHELMGTPVLDHPGMPRVALMASQTLPNISATCYDENSYFDAAFGHFARVGRRKLAVLLTATRDDDGQVRLIQSKAREFGLELPKRRIQSVHPLTPSWAENVMEMLFHPQSAEVPDALLILDDNLVESAQRGLLAAGIGAESPVEILAHCNWPTPPSRILPMKFIGYDAVQALRKSIGLIGQQRRTGGGAQSTLIPARFEPFSSNNLSVESFSADISAVSSTGSQENAYR